jgi:hypothetical protein
MSRRKITGSYPSTSRIVNLEAQEAFFSGSDYGAQTSIVQARAKRYCAAVLGSEQEVVDLHARAHDLIGRPSEKALTSHYCNRGRVRPAAAARVFGPDLGCDTYFTLRWHRSTAT